MELIILNVMAFVDSHSLIIIYLGGGLSCVTVSQFRDPLKGSAHKAGSFRGPESQLSLKLDRN